MSLCLQATVSINSINRACLRGERRASNFTFDIKLKESDYHTFRPVGRENILLYFPSTLCLTSVTQVLITIIYYWEKRPRVKAEMIIEKPRQECLWSIINPCFK